MNKRLLAANSGHMATILRDFLWSGWRIESIPDSGRIPRNGMMLVLRLHDEEVRVRLFAYAVTTSSRNRVHERRVEITTTYMSGLAALRRYGDIVLGVDRASGKYVGVDNRRLRMGGKTHNASSFFDLEGLSVRRGELLVNPRAVSTPIFPAGVEHHAFFDRRRLTEYLFNYRQIHSGLYMFTGGFKLHVSSSANVSSALAATYVASGDAFVLVSRVIRQGVPQRVSQKLISAVEERDLTAVSGRKVTPEQLRRLLAICDEIGILGEQAVLTHERKRLRKLGFRDLAQRVQRVSLESVSEGFDILSFEDDGVTRRYLEVKATSGNGSVVEMSAGEWKAAKRFGDRYYLVRVTQVRQSPRLFYVQNPVKLEKQGLVTRMPTGWKLDLRRAVTELI